MSHRFTTFCQSAKQTHPEFTTHYDTLIEYFTTNPFEGYLPPDLVTKLVQLSPQSTEENSIIHALTPLMYMASSYAKCECSRFPVGGCGYCKDSGRAYIGFNMEANKQWIQYTVHGEQCTVNNAYIHGEKQIDILVISFTPCGFCRQFLNQLKNREELIIHIITLNKTVKLPELLPFDFRPSDLPSIEFPNVNEFEITIECEEINTCSINRTNSTDSINRTCSKNSENSTDSNNTISKNRTDENEKYIQEMKEYIDQTVQCAKESRLDNLLCYLGVGLVTKDRVFVKGNYIENCAHNPSFHPMNGAISQLLLHGKEMDDVECVILVEYEKAEFQMKLSALNIMKGYGYKGQAKFIVVWMK